MLNNNTRIRKYITRMVYREDYLCVLYSTEYLKGIMYSIDVHTVSSKKLGDYEHDMKVPPISSKRGTIQWRLWLTVFKHLDDINV